MPHVYIMCNKYYQCSLYCPLEYCSKALVDSASVDFAKVSVRFLSVFIVTVGCLYLCDIS